jgi:hypothetical protein
VEKKFLKPTSLKQLLADGFHIGSQNRIVRIWHKIVGRDRAFPIRTSDLKLNHGNRKSSTERQQGAPEGQSRATKGHG